MESNSSELVIDRLKDQFCVDQVLLVGRASLGLILILRVWLRRYGNPKVALSPIVCQDVIAALIEAGCEPFFVDLDPVSGVIPKTEWMRARLNGCRAAIVVHLYGNSSNVKEVKNIFNGVDCLVIDDAAQAFGTLFEGNPAGSLGDVGLLSFGETKQIETGGGAVLLRDSDFADEIKELINQLSYSNPDVVKNVKSDFRFRLSQTRKELISIERDSAELFKGLLNNFARSLYSELDLATMETLYLSLKEFPVIAQKRKNKSRIWRETLDGSKLKPIETDESCVPWRYVCRLPGATWRQQFEVSERFRNFGINVSNWYLPGHWFIHGRSLNLPGAEQLSREVFQFWIDGSISEQQISEQACQVFEEIQNYEII